MLSPDDIQAIGQIDSAQITPLGLAPGDDAPESPWRNLVNTRLLSEGEYRFWKTRGGSAVAQDFSGGQVLTVYPFSATIDGEITPMMAVHTDQGNAYLYFPEDNAHHTIYPGIFRTDGQITFIHHEQFLYIFDPAERQYKVYDLVRNSLFDWISGIGKSITTYEWLTGSWRRDNIWGLKEGAPVLVLHKFTDGVYTDPDTGQESFRAFLTRADSVFAGYFTYDAPDGATYQSNTPGVAFAGAGPDVRAAYEGGPGAYTMDGGTPVTNDDFTEPILHRSYLLVDLRSDGSFLTPGRPITVSTSFSLLNSERQIGLRLHFPQAATGVSKRYLYATRWQATPADAHRPSRPAYPNSPYFLVKTVEATQTSAEDRTPDDQLLTGLGERFPMLAGVSQIFGPSQIEPHSVAAQNATLLLGGYRINRPVPAVYPDPENLGEGNAWYRQVGSGTTLTGEPELAIQYEYTDGKSSQMVDTGHILTTAEEELTIGPEATKASVTFQVTTEPEGPGTVELSVVSIGGAPVSIGYDTPDSGWDVVSALASAVNDSSLASAVTASVVGGANPGIRIEWDTPGEAGNDESVDLNWSSTINFENHSGTNLIKAMTGGTDGAGTTGDFLLPGHRVTFHSLNALVASIHVMVKLGSDYKIVQTIGVGDPEFHGQTLFLPNTNDAIAALAPYSPPPAAQIAEQVDLPGYVAPASPFAEVRISEQRRIEGSARIGRLVPWQFDPDKTRMRYRILAFTDRNIQMGYMDFGQSAAFTFNADFEVILEGMKATSFDAIGSVAGAVFWPGENAAWLWAGDAPIPLFDVRRYSVSEANNPIDVLHNSVHGELWIIYPSQEIVVVRLADRGARRMSYPSLDPIRAGSSFDGRIYMGAGTRLVETDLASLSYDMSPDNPVLASATSAHIGSPQTRAKILEVTVGGDQGTVALGVDLQGARREYEQGEWPRAFSADESYPEKNLYIHGASFSVRRRAVMPRLRVEWTGGVIEHITLTQVVTENRGRARQS